MSFPTIRVEARLEHHKAKWWREHVIGMTPDKLAELTGYSRRTIYLMEMGVTAHGKAIKPWVWQRYTLACAGVHARLKHQMQFDWGQ